MTLLLAPMEGLLDFVLRDVLTRVGGIDRCVSEFIRVTNTLLPERAFYRVVPELRNGGRTPAGTPVRAQLLGSDPVCLAENAARLASLGPAGIDINFGCPAAVVNRHGGGAALLQNPEQLAVIMAAVRRAVPAAMPVSAKMRLGYSDASRAVECAQAIASGGANEIVVHARTKADGYRPPAHWDLIPAIAQAVAIPVVANGEIWTVEDALRCRAVSGCTMLMLGRGMVSDPGLARAICSADALAHGTADVVGANGHDLPTLAQAHAHTGTAILPPLGWSDLLPHLHTFWALVCEQLEPRQRPGRLKQWLNLLRRRHPEAELAFTQLRTVNQQADITRWVEHHCGAIAHIPLASEV